MSIEIGDTVMLTEEYKEGYLYDPLSKASPTFEVMFKPDPTSKNQHHRQYYLLYSDFWFENKWGHGGDAAPEEYRKKGKGRGHWWVRVDGLVPLSTKTLQDCM